MGLILPDRKVLTDAEHAALLAFFQTQLRVEPHAAQQDLLRYRTRYKILLCGRRWGKTLYLALELLTYVHWFHEMEHPNPRVRLVAPEHPQVKEVMHYFAEFCARAGLPFKESKDPRDPHFKAGRVRLEPRSARNPSTHRGPGLSLLVLDEVSDIHPDLYYFAMAPSLSDYQGHVIMAGTPKGFNWVVQLAESQGIELPYHNLSGWNLLTSPDQRVVMMRSPTWSNPHIPPEEVEFQRRVLPDSVFRQEYGAEILLNYQTPFPVRPVWLPHWEPQDEAMLEHALWAVGVDYGYKSESAVVVAAYAPDGAIRVPLVGYETYIDEDQFVEWVARHLDAKRGRGPILAVIGDADFESERGRRTLSARLRQLGYPVLSGIRDRVVRWARLRECLNTVPIRILEPYAAGLMHEFQQAKPHPTRLGDIAKPDHALTALAYALDFLLKQNPQYQTDTPSEPYQQEMAAFFRQNFRPPDSSLSGPRVVRRGPPILQKARWR